MRLIQMNENVYVVFQVPLRKVAHFAATLKRSVREKLWKGIFKHEKHRNLDTAARAERILKTYTMLYLSKKYNKNIPDELKRAIPTAIDAPSKFIAGFLRSDSGYVNATLLAIYNALLAESDSESLFAVQENYRELTREALRNELNEEDCMKAANLQYLILAYLHHSVNT